MLAVTHLWKCFKGIWLMNVQRQCHRLHHHLRETIAAHRCSGKTFWFQCTFAWVQFLDYFHHRETNSPMTPIKSIESPIQPPQMIFQSSLCGFSRPNSPPSNDTSPSNLNNSFTHTSDNSNLLELMVCSIGVFNPEKCILLHLKNFISFRII